jgi:transcriptional regulator with XRE-family HTH domain
MYSMSARRSRGTPIDGKKVRKLREAKGWTMENLAEETSKYDQRPGKEGLAAFTIGDAERNNKHLDGRSIRLLAKALGVAPEELQLQNPSHLRNLPFLGDPPSIEPPAGQHVSAGPAGAETITDSQDGIPPSRLVIVSDTAKREFAVDRTPIVIGRGPLCDVVLPVEIVSNPHAELSFARDCFHLTDKCSKNGTFLQSGTGRTGEERLQPGVAVPLKPGARFRVGRVVLELVSGDGDEGDRG